MRIELTASEMAIANVVAAMLGKGVDQLSRVAGYGQYDLLWWHPTAVYYV